MPFFPSDVSAALSDAATTTLSQKIFGNPFISAAVLTLAVFVILIFMSTTIDIKEISRIVMVVYILSLSLLFFNNTVLMNHLSSMDAALTEITPVQQFIGRSEPSGFSAQPAATVNNYNEHFLDT